jgi:hypothetical protein
MIKITTNNECSDCGRQIAVTSCDHCGKRLCRKCCKLELWGTGAEDLSARYFCSVCKADPDVNPWGAHGVASDIENERDVEVRMVRVA